MRCRRLSQAVAFAAVVNDDARAEIAQACAESQLVSAFQVKVQGEIRLTCRQGFGHHQQRRQADAGGKQQRARRVRQRKVVAWRGYLHLIADGQLLM